MGPHRHESPGHRWWEDRLASDYPAAARNVAERLRNAELVIFPEVGHSPHFDNPDEYYGELIRFLRSDPDEPAAQKWRSTDVGVRGFSP